MIRLFEAPSEKTRGLVVHYDADGIQPVYREFEEASEARTAFWRLAEFRARLRAKGLERSGRLEAGEAMILYTRWREDTWVREQQVGSGVALVTLGRWVELRTLRQFERPIAKLGAFFFGCLARGILYILVQRFEPRLQQPRKSGLLARLANAILKWMWPALRVTINDVVNATVPTIVNGAIAKLAKKPIDKITSMDLDVGAYAPEITSFVVSPSFAGNDFVDVDVGVRFRGDGARLGIDVNVGGDDLPDATGEVKRCEVDGALRIKLGPLITPLPCVEFVAVGLSAKPRLHLDTHFRLHDAVTQLPLGVSLDAIDRFVNRLIENVLENLLCWPRRVKVPIARLLLGHDYAPVAEDEAPSAPIGTLRVEVLRCTDLINNDVGGLSDPYVVCKVGQQEERTVALGDTCDPQWPNPRTFVFDVHESSQLCAVSVYDSEADNFGAFNDALLGRATFRLADTIDDAAVVASPPTTASQGTTTGLSVTSRSAAAVKTPPDEIRLALDTSVYDGKLKTFGRGGAASHHHQSAVYLLAKFTPHKVSPHATKRSATNANNIADQPRGLAPVGVALAVVLALAVLLDLLAGPTIRAVTTLVANATLLGVSLLAFLLALLLVLGALV
ncbi:hypothetical protein CTAYLR_008054 [Chrysophaeum taylorii]|uniref:C2 domain-containing protein n=1 Tax=Chrysophaeum taylorii TaxID=2483200 RepID=A0AAD7XPU5_9STRA|nr:hypothetical protein CTAYLR_008054 [Chrysophaeum taylorii]